MSEFLLTEIDIRLIGIVIHRSFIFVKLVEDKMISCVLLELSSISNCLSAIGGTISGVRKLPTIMFEMPKFMQMFQLLDPIQQFPHLEFREVALA